MEEERRGVEGGREDGLVRGDEEMMGEEGKARVHGRRENEEMREEEWLE